MNKATTLHLLRLAVWSGPRNISTALMRSWGNRPDTFVIDEPFYAHYLQETRAPHPGIDEVITHHETDWRKVIDILLGPIPKGKSVFYQKQMNKHMLEHINMGWLPQMTNCFLIREPKDMITSFIKVVPNPTLDEFGLREQVEMFRQLRATQGESPIVIEAKDVLQNPRKILKAWCERLNIPFYESMLQWEPGFRDTDGVWSKYWYDNVCNSTRFASYKPKNEDVPMGMQDLLSRCEELYEELYPHRIQ